MNHPDKWKIPRRSWNPFDITRPGDDEMEKLGYPKPKDGRGLYYIVIIAFIITVIIHICTL